MIRNTDPRAHHWAKTELDLTSALCKALAESPTIDGWGWPIEIDGEKYKAIHGIYPPPTFYEKRTSGHYVCTPKMIAWQKMYIAYCRNNWAALGVGG